MSKNNKSIKETIATNKTEAICICLVFLFYIFMMMYRLTYSPLWFDEHIEHLISQMSLTTGEMYQNIIITFQPPLYNFIMHFWLMAGTGDFWFRFFNVVLGVITGISIYATLRRLYSFKAATFAIALLSVCYQYIYCVQECSEYQLMVMNIALMICFYVKARFSGVACIECAFASDNSKSIGKKFGINTNRKLYINTLLFVFFAVCAMYSQYGAMFMVIPFLALYWFQVVFDKNKKNTIIVTVLYGIAGICGALPLYILYASKQLAENAIAENAGVTFGLSEFLGLFTEPGRIIAYLYNIPMNSVTNLFLGIAGVLFIIVSVLIIIGKIKACKNDSIDNADMSAKLNCSDISNTSESGNYLAQNKSSQINRARQVVASLIGILLAGYVLHYFLVVFHIYAMIHPGESAGFYARYSYFYIPLMVVALTCIFMEIKRIAVDNRIAEAANSVSDSAEALFGSGKSSVGDSSADTGKTITVRKVNIVLCAIFAVITITIFVPRIMRNWHKSYDDVFVATWITEKGWEEQTYLVGQARFGFKRYVTDVYGEAIAANAFHESQVNFDYLPDSFWIWRMSWGGEKFDDFVNEARNRGYNVEILYDFGTEGQLAHATK